MKKICKSLFILLFVALIYPSFAQKKEHRRQENNRASRKSLSSTYRGNSASQVSGANTGDAPTQLRATSTGRSRTPDFESVTTAPNYYVSADGEPWGSGSNTNAMNNSFGTGNWSRVTFADPDVLSIFDAATEFIFLEGSDSNADDLAAFLTANLPSIEAWVSAGGRLLVNAAPNVGGDIDFGFDGTILKYENGQSQVTVVDASIMSQPFELTTVTYLGGSFSHAHVTGSGLRSLILGANENIIVLAEKIHGEGMVVFGGITTPNFHSPQPDAGNLRANILYYVANASTVPAAPEAKFAASQTDAIVSREISLVDISTHYPTNRTWTITPSTFEYVSGTDEHSSYPRLRFTAAGSYSITLTVSNTLGEDVLVKENYVTVTLPVKFYWVGGSGTWFDYENHWATSSGGNEFHERIPSENDNVYFDVNSFPADGQIVDLGDNDGNAYDVDFSGVTHTPEIIADEFEIQGSLRVPGPVKFSIDAVGLTSSDYVTVDLTGAQFVGETEIWTSGRGTFNFVSGFEAEDFSIWGGTVNTNGHTIKVGDFNASQGEGSSFAIAINFGNTELHVYDDFDFYNEGNIIFTGDFKLFLGAEDRTPSLECNFELPDVTLISAARFDDDITFGKLTITPGTSVDLNEYLHTVGTLEIKGTAEDNIIITNGTFSKASGTVVAEYVQLTSVTAEGGAAFYADKNSTDNGGNTGWIFSTKETQTIAFGELADKIYGAGFNVSASTTSALAVVFEIVSGPATISGNTITITGAGEVTVRAYQNGDDTYMPAQDVLQAFTVIKAAQNLSFTVGSLTYGQAPVTINTTPGESGNDVTYSIESGPATISGHVITLTGAGTIVVKAIQDGNDNYDAAEMTKEIAIAKAVQTIVFSLITTKTFGDASFAVSAAGGTSGNPLLFFVLSGPAAIAGSTVTLTGGGPVTIEAWQAGNKNYLAANVEQVFCVNPAKPAVTVTGLDTETTVLTSTAAEGYQWFNNGTAIPGAMGKTHTATEAGIYTVATNASNCASVPSDAQVLIVTGIEGTLETFLKAYPNPVMNELVVDMTTVNSHKEISVALYDVSGRLMTTAKGKGTVSIPMQSYRPGQYAVVVHFDTQRITKHIIKK